MRTLTRWCAILAWVPDCVAIVAGARAPTSPPADAPPEELAPGAVIASLPDTAGICVDRDRCR
jgi:hypothetical protein